MPAEIFGADYPFLKAEQLLSTTELNRIVRAFVALGTEKLRLTDSLNGATPIQGLYLCGSGTHPGNGLTGGSGANAAREIAKDLRKR